MLLVFHNGIKPDKPDSDAKSSLRYFLMTVFAGVSDYDVCFLYLVKNRIHTDAPNCHFIISDEDIRELQ